jgi:hypothetical protein
MSKVRQRVTRRNACRAAYGKARSQTRASDRTEPIDSPPPNARAPCRSRTPSDQLQVPGATGCCPAISLRPAEFKIMDVFTTRTRCRRDADGVSSKRRRGGGTVRARMRPPNLSGGRQAARGCSLNLSRSLALLFLQAPTGSLLHDFAPADRTPRTSAGALPFKRLRHPARDRSPRDGES